MSWIDKLNNNVFSIETGDGKIYFPLFKTGSKSKDFNNSTFEFINLEGTYIDRKKAKGNKHTLVFWLQGADNIEQSQEFETSANDPRIWKINHPFYGIIFGQPLALDIDDTLYNATQITVDFWESISQKGVKKTISTVDLLTSKATDYNKISAQIYEAKTDIKPIDKAKVKQNVTDFSLRYNSLLDDSGYNDFIEIQSQTFQSIDEIITAPAKAIQDTNILIAFPERFNDSVNFRLNLMNEIYNDIKSIGSTSRNDKSYFEALGGAVIQAVIGISLKPRIGDYTSRNDVLLVSDFVNSIYLDYLSTLDNFQVNIENENDAFSIGFEGANNLASSVNTCLENLFNLAFDAKQERFYRTEKDTNLIILTHKFIGLDLLDENIESFRKINGIKNKFLFKVKKGKQIKYLV